jgi:hypothetical protein
MFFFSMGFRSSTEKVSNVLLFQEQKKNSRACFISDKIESIFAMREIKLGERSFKKNNFRN